MGREAEAERNDRRVLDAARQVFSTRGADAPIAAVAERAGVGMGSLYRRYGSKAELLQPLCLLAMEEAIDAAREGLAEDDPWDGLVLYIRKCVAFRAGALAPLAGTIEATPEMWRVARRSRALVRRLATRAHGSGALRPDVTALDVTYLIEQLGRRSPTGPANDETGENVDQRVLAIVLDGLRARDDIERLPGPAPSTKRYEARWSTPRDLP